jgi:serine/threonine protein kinase
MGEVYRARDTKLGRSVAVKVLPEAFAADPDRIARFEREAKVLASLNHAHIAALYGMEQDAGRHFLVMELVEGETLADRLHRGAIPVEEALKIAHQIADALDTAHEQGVVHRDLKPANVKITPDEKVKVLDFGLAKAMTDLGDGFQAVPGQTRPNATHSPTLSMMATQAGGTRRLCRSVTCSRCFSLLLPFRPTAAGWRTRPPSPTHRAYPSSCSLSRSPGPNTLSPASASIRGGRPMERNFFIDSAARPLP